MKEERERDAVELMQMFEVLSGDVHHGRTLVPRHRVNWQIDLVVNLHRVPQRGGVVSHLLLPLVTSLTSMLGLPWLADCVFYSMCVRYEILCQLKK